MDSKGEALAIHIQKNLLISEARLVELAAELFFGREDGRAGGDAAAALAEGLFFGRFCRAQYVGGAALHQGHVASVVAVVQPPQGQVDGPKVNREGAVAALADGAATQAVVAGGAGGQARILAAQ